MTQPENTRVLLVDDEVDFINSLGDILREFGYAVSLASDAETAMSLTREQVFDVAVVDLKMPGCDGIELQARLRRQQSDLATILLTAHADQQAREAADAAGFWRILEKPLDIPAMTELLAHYSKAPHLLVVDDEPDFGDALQQILNQNEIRAAFCSSIRAAIDSVQQKSFDVILLDLKFPQESPVDLVEFLRQHQEETTVLIMTGHSGDEKIQSILNEIGDTEVIPKPIDIKSLLVRLSSDVATKDTSDE